VRHRKAFLTLTQHRDETVTRLLRRPVTPRPDASGSCCTCASSLEGHPARRFPEFVFVSRLTLTSSTLTPPPSHTARGLARAVQPQVVGQPFTTRVCTCVTGAVFRNVAGRRSWKAHREGIHFAFVSSAGSHCKYININQTYVQVKDH